MPVKVSPSMDFTFTNTIKKIAIPELDICTVCKMQRKQCPISKGHWHIFKLVGQPRHVNLGLHSAYLILDIHVMVDSCLNKVSTDQYHMITSQAQVQSSSRSNNFFKLTADQVLVFLIEVRAQPLSGLGHLEGLQMFFTAFIFCSLHSDY